MGVLAVLVSILWFLLLVLPWFASEILGVLVCDCMTVLVIGAALIVSKL